KTVVTATLERKAVVVRFFASGWENSTGRLVFTTPVVRMASNILDLLQKPTAGESGAIMLVDRLVRDLFAEIAKIPQIDSHSHIDPHKAAARSLDDILGYHYYTELAHSAGMTKDPLGLNVEPRERVRAILAHLDRFDNTAQYSWFLEIARTFLGFRGERVS